MVIQKHEKEELSQMNMKDYNKEYQRGLILRLMKNEQDNLKKVGEVILEGVKTASMAFSIDGSLFAFYLKEKR